MSALVVRRPGRLWPHAGLLGRRWVRAAAVGAGLVLAATLAGCSPSKATSMTVHANFPDAFQALALVSQLRGVLRRVEVLGSVQQASGRTQGQGEVPAELANLLHNASHDRPVRDTEQQSAGLAR